MAEALGVAASVIAVIELTDRVVELCRAYIGSATEASRDLRRILAEVSAVKAILENLQFLGENDAEFSGVLQILERQEGLIPQCTRCVAELEKLFPPDVRGTGKGKERMQRVLTSLSWPLKEAKAKKLLGELAAHKLNLSLVLTTESTQDIKGVKMGVQRVEKSLSEKDRRDVLSWLQRTNPSNNHNCAVDLREGGTAEWILERDLFKQWVDHAGPHRGLWIHGIPGAGKTVLASCIIDHLTNACKTASGSRLVVYYYCSHLRHQDEGEDLLRWLICQLCRHTNSISETLFEAFQSDCEPSLDDLLNLLPSCLEGIDTLYIVVDALDESQPRDNLLRVLRALVADDERMSKVSLVATSRQYVDIETAFAGTWTVLEMEWTDVEQDIWNFVSSSLSEPIFRRWPQDLRYQMQDALTSRARGMFRWVVCQLDVLRRLRSAEKVRETIKSLPRTMEETYDMIFSLLPEEDLDVVRTVLTLICGHQEVSHGTTALPYAIAELAIQHGKGSEFYQTGDLREICGCLIALETSSRDAVHRDWYPDIVFLAHYTVEEFLYSEAISQGRFASLALTPEKARRSYIQTLHRLARSLPAIELGADPKTAPGQLSRFCHENIYDYIIYWESDIVNDHGLTTQALEYLRKTGRCYFDLARRNATSEVTINTEPQDLSPTVAMFLWFYACISTLEDCSTVDPPRLSHLFLDSCDIAAIMEEKVGWCVRERIIRKPDLGSPSLSGPDGFREPEERHGKLWEYLAESWRRARGYCAHEQFMETLLCLVETHDHERTCKDDGECLLARLLAAPYAATDFPFDAEYRLANCTPERAWGDNGGTPFWDDYRDYEVQFFLAAILKDHVDLEGVVILLRAGFDPSVAITEGGVKRRWRLRTPMPPTLDPTEGNPARYITDFPIIADPGRRHTETEASRRTEVQRLLSDAVKQLRALPRADAHFRGEVERRYLDGDVDALKDFSRTKK
ncbi:hypothetical protein PG991_010641 [Apiospora marii]|uniref:Nephrocystin 3-like N-terminal domain-containing protein n=1 Tax=Apiospora marii TaxID=335849 RepID=A0ABR1RCA5_9PEZI